MTALAVHTNLSRTRAPDAITCSRVPSIAPPSPAHRPTRPQQTLVYTNTFAAPSRSSSIAWGPIGRRNPHRNHERSARNASDEQPTTTPIPSPSPQHGTAAREPCHSVRSFASSKGPQKKATRYILFIHPAHDSAYYAVMPRTLFSAMSVKRGFRIQAILHVR